LNNYNDSPAIISNILFIFGNIYIFKLSRVKKFSDSYLYYSPTNSIKK